MLILLAAAALLSIDDFPILPLAIAMLIMPSAALFLRSTLYRKNRSEDVRSGALHTSAGSSQRLDAVRRGAALRGR